MKHHGRIHSLKSGRANHGEREEQSAECAKGECGEGCPLPTGGRGYAPFRENV